MSAPFPIPMTRPSRETLGERMTRHGHTAGGKSSPTYTCWLAMHARCSNPNLKAFSQYGARGIAVCARWEKFEHFVEDMGERPSLLFSIDRINSALGYSPENCRWATRREQRLNQMRVRRVARSDGVVFRSPTEAAESVCGSTQGIHHACIGRQRLHRGFGWRYV